MPGSQVDLRPVRNLEKYIGEVVQAASTMSRINQRELRKNLLAIARRKTGGPDGPEEE